MEQREEKREKNNEKKLDTLTLDCRNKKTSNFQKLQKLSLSSL